MDMVLIYGPPASGKLTIAEELAKELDYKVFYNHEVVASVARLFPYGEKEYDLIRARLSRKLRIEIFVEAAKNGVNFITTYGNAGQSHFEFFKDIISAIKSHGGNVFLVQLIADKSALEKRVVAEERKGKKIDSTDFLNKLFQQNPALYDKFQGLEHLTVDNTNLSPKKAARKIIDFYHLS